MTANTTAVSTRTLSQITDGAIISYSEVKGLSVIMAGGSDNYDPYTVIIDNANKIRAFPNKTQTNAFAIISIWF